jgi:putative NADH-flavin reductase
MKIAVIGASGRLGGAIAREALRRGHHVTAVTRDAAARTGPPGATAASADILDPAAVARVIAGHDAVVASVKGRGDAELRVTPDAARSLVTALPAAGVARLLFVGGAGSLLAAPGTRLVDLPSFPAAARPQSLAQARALEFLRAHGGALDWSYLSPPPAPLVDTERTGAYRVAAGDEPISGGALSVADLAAAALDALEQGAFIRQRFTVGR